MPQFNNKQIVKLLREMAAAHEIKGEGRFQTMAYKNAADSIEHLGNEVFDLWQENRLDEIPAVGSSIAGYLDELFRTGEVKHFEEIKIGLSSGMFVILGLPGIGPKTAYKISKELKIKTIDDLKKACENHLVSKIEGLGLKIEEDILKGIKANNNTSDRLLLPEADQIAQGLIFELWDKLEGDIPKDKGKIIKRIDPLGSLRRMSPTIGDIDLAVASNQPQKVIKAFVSLKSVERILDQGDRKASVMLKNGRRVDLMVEPPQKYGSLLQHFTGSKFHNIALRKLAKEKGMSLSEYGIKGEEFSEDTIVNYIEPKFLKRIKVGSMKMSQQASNGSSECDIFSNEADFYRALGLDYIEPELREDQGEIAAAKNHQLPALLTLGDIKGDFHLHSNFPIEPTHDLGGNSMAEMVERANSLNYEYLAFSEHSPAISTHSEREIIELVRKRNQAIDLLKLGSDSAAAGSDPMFDALPMFNMLKGMEVDILADGQLSLPDKVLKELDLVLVGIHSSHHQDKKTMTARLLRALQNPYVNILTHPTNRLLLERDQGEVDWDQIFAICADRHIALEINAHPKRLDLPDDLIRQAKKIGVKFVINTDAHAVLEMANMKYGVAMARRGWCEKSDILNTWPLEKALKWFLERR